MMKNKLYCPYCPTKYQFQRELNDGTLVCGLCGDPLVRRSPVKVSQLFALVVSMVFVMPIILMTLTFLEDSKVIKLSPSPTYLLED